MSEEMKVYIVETSDDLLESWFPMGVYLQREAAENCAEALRHDDGYIRQFARVVEMKVADTEACQTDADGLDCGHVRNSSAYEVGYRDGSVHYELDHCPACKNVVDLQEALDENAKLREELEQWHRLTAGIELPEYPITEFKPKDLERENAKLRVERDEWRRVAVSKQDSIDHMRDANAENAKLRKENDTLCRRIDELCREVESLRRTAKRIVKFNHDTDYATGHSECSECHGTVNPCARFCEHCGALFKEGE